MYNKLGSFIQKRSRFKEILPLAILLEQLYIFFRHKHSSQLQTHLSIRQRTKSSAFGRTEAHDYP